PLLAVPGHRDRDLPPACRGTDRGHVCHRRQAGRIVSRVSSLPARRSGGAEGNERLTAMTGAVLLILLAVECYTILRIGRLLTLHVFLGMLLLGPVTLKAGSVIYRFVRYYTSSEPYRRRGPPGPRRALRGRTS